MRLPDAREPLLRALAFIVSTSCCACLGQVTAPAGVDAPARDGGDDDAGPAPPPSEPSGTFVRTARRAADLSATPPAAGAFRLHLIDVGTGLAVLVQGHDFSLLFDGGSNDDNRGISSAGNGSRLLAYLFAALGPSGPPACRPDGDAFAEPTGERVIDHVVLSHPHLDHGSMLDEVLACYRVAHVWDVGVGADAAFYGDFLDAVAREPGVALHTVAPPPADRTVTVGTRAIAFDPAMAWATVVEGDVETLGGDAAMTVLFADATPHSDANDNSFVLRLDLGPTSLLLTGDAESGARELPEAAPDGAEAALLARHPDELDVEILQVGHHGSLTSSRAEFLAAVSPALALIGAGPRAYTGVVLPDAPVLDALAALGPEILRTDASDGAGCPEPDRVGLDDDAPGGCDNFVIDVRP